MREWNWRTGQKRAYRMTAVKLEIATARDGVVDRSGEPTGEVTR